MWIVEVLPIKRGLQKDSLTYFSAEEIPEGALVSVPLRSKTIDAIVTHCRNVKEEKQAIKSGSLSLRKVTKVKSTSIIPSYIFETAQILGQYYRRARGELLDLIASDLALFADIKVQRKSTPLIPEDIQPERLIFQAPIEERISYYRTRTREAFARGESLCIVVPTIADCLLFQEALSRGIADFVVMFHSELTKKKFTESFKKLATLDHPLVVITTPSFAAYLRPDTGTIILEHESSNAYSTPTVPAYDFRTIIEVLARCAGRTFIASDSLLRVETLGRREQKEFGTVAPITFRALAPIIIDVTAHGVPEEVPLRMRSEQIPAFSSESYIWLKKALERKHHIFAFAVRTGLATFTRCRDCGQVLSCEHCASTLVLYASGTGRRVFICNKCKRHIPSEQKCTRCGSWNLSAVGVGTAFVEEELHRLFPETSIFRIDREVTPTRKEALKTIAAFFEAPMGILVGTEMALYYMNHSVDDSIVVSFDTLFNIPSYRTNERIIELLLAIAERTKNKIHIQTKNTEEPIINLIKNNNYGSWYRTELEERREYQYPPFTTILKITWKGKDSEKEAVRDYLADILKAFSPDIFESTVSTKGKRETAIHAVIRPSIQDWSIGAITDGKGLSEILRKALANLPENTVISVNPDNLL